MPTLKLNAVKKDYNRPSGIDATGKNPFRWYNVGKRVIKPFDHHFEQWLNAIKRKNPFLIKRFWIYILQDGAFICGVFFINICVVQSYLVALPYVMRLTQSRGDKKR